MKKGEGEYPPGLLDLRDGPPLLYVRGVLPREGIAIVGSRTPPGEAERFAFELASRASAPVISGLALGVDTAAHRGALSTGIATVAYVGHGFGETYPPQNAGLEREIAECGGAVATERPPGARVAKWTLVKRDRLQAAHARAVVLIASDEEGGAMHTVAFARALGRPVFAVVPPAQSQGSPQWGGNVRALAEGAQALTLDDVDEALQVIG
ncbi:MAG: DNA-processing protein DprA [Candidatus Eremiobacteraeota bacterium]|nr:DNA-processing protein DprA [Candidatus Eremiobacteraeota bacterium]